MAFLQVPLLVVFGTFLPCVMTCLAAPVLAPDLSFCHHGIVAPYNCCAPISHQPPIDFQLETNPTIKVRRPAHSLDDSYAQKLSLAYQLMRALPHDDPRSFGQQANIHCAYCNEFYQQGNNATTPLQIHASWLFFSFHRWYLYFHERILAKLLGDDTFALAFWNYDHPDGSSMPRIFVEYPELKDPKRDPSHQPPAVVTIDAISRGRADLPNDEQLNVNRAAFYWVMVTAATTQYRFFGQPYRAGYYQMPGYGSVESMPHNSVHAWTGDSAYRFTDMGKFFTAARDPIFYAHHANLDRLWNVWKTLSEGNVDIDDPDYLDTEFVFYNENAELVRVKVRDSLNSSLLGVLYEDVENLWLNYTPVASSSGVAQLSEEAVICNMGELLEYSCSALVPRHIEASYDGEETLVVEGIQVQSNTPTQFNVFVNLPTANASTLPNCTEYAGTFSTLASTPVVTSLRLGIGTIVKALNLSMENGLVVTIVPGFGSSGITISDITIQYEYNFYRSYVQ